MYHILRECRIIFHGAVERVPCEAGRLRRAVHIATTDMSQFGPIDASMLFGKIAV